MIMVRYSYSPVFLFPCHFLILFLVGEALSEASDDVSLVVEVSVSCNGSEGSLSQCSSFPNPQCFSDSNVARIRCTQGTVFN